jgi:hypothetical protein
VETEPEKSKQSTPPEEPVPAVPTHETTPVWARTVPVAPPVDEGALQSATNTASEADPLPALPMQKTSDPEWAHTETRPNEPDTVTGPKQAVAMQKPTPTWAQTVPAPLDETSTPARGESGIAISSPAVSINDSAPPQEVIPAATDIWPPDPPTEHTMPAWPPSSTIRDDLPEPETIPEAEAINSWPNSFDAVPASPAKPSFAPPAHELKTQPPAASAPPAIKRTVPPAKATPPATTKLPAETTPPAATVPPAATETPAIAPTVPPAPASVAPAAPVPPQVTSPPPVPEAPEKPAAPATSSPAPAPARAASDPSVEWPAAVPIPSWAPQIRVGTTHTDDWNPAQPAAPAPQPAAPAPAPKPAPVPQQPAAQQPAPKLPVAQPPAAASSKSTWEVVEQKQKAGQAKVVPTPEDRSYAEWFSWAKRGGAPASACHAAAQGAFQALSSGKDVATAVQWATAAMSRPPVPVSADRQSYCAWFSLANIDLNLDQHKAHSFATAAVHALDAGSDAGAAHAAGLAAAGIR